MKFVSLDGEEGQGTYLPECLENIWEPEKIKALGRYMIGPPFWVEKEKAYGQVLWDEEGRVMGHLYKKE